LSDDKLKGKKVASKAAKCSPMEQRLIDSEVRYRRLFESAQDGIAILDPKTGTITEVNPYLIKLLDYPKTYFVGKALWEIGLFNDIEASRKAFKELQVNKYVRYDDLPLKSRDGRAISVEFVSNVYGVKGNQVIQCNIRDISARKSNEEVGRRLLQAQKMEAIGQLAGGVAHDFNNLLQIILGYSVILRERVDLPEPVRTMIAAMGEAGTSAKNLTQRLLAFSRQQVLQPVMLDLNEAVNRVQLLLVGLIGADIALEGVLAQGLGTIEADPHQIEQVLMNLAINARDAMPKGGKITFETANVEIDDTYVSQQFPMKPGRYVMLSVRDTGTGMNEQTQSHVFEPFYTTKLIDKGTGLGLSTVFGIVKQSQGAIAIYSELDHGTTFKIHFPRRDEAAIPVREKKANSLEGGTETILLVDDAPPLRILLRAILERRGYTVLDCGDPAEALTIARNFKGPLPLMITDVIMPGCSGPVLAERLAVERPETRVLYTSGDPGNAALCGMWGIDYAFLGKPFTGDDLLSKVRRVLDSARGLSTLHAEIK
jgi:PAS domain S-box-containing protein